MQRIHFGHLLPELPGSPAHGMQHGIVVQHMAPAGRSTCNAEELLQPFIAEREHRLSGDHQPGLTRWHAALAQLLGTEEIEEIAASTPSKGLIGVRGA